MEDENQEAAGEEQTPQGDRMEDDEKHARALFSYGDRIQAAAEGLGNHPGGDALHTALEYVAEAVEGHGRTLTALHARQRQQYPRIETRARELARQARELVKNQRD